MAGETALRFDSFEIHVRIDLGLAKVVRTGIQVSLVFSHEAGDHSS